MEYTYYLDLEDQWQFELVNNVVFVRAPNIRFNRPAVDVSQIKYEIKKGSILRNSQSAMDQLRKGISDLVVQKAQDNTALVKELGRKKTEDFIRTWMGGAFPQTGPLVVKVMFEGEETGTPNIKSPASQGM